MTDLTRRGFLKGSTAGSLAIAQLAGLRPATSADAAAAGRAASGRKYPRH